MKQKWYDIKRKWYDIRQKWCDLEHEWRDLEQMWFRAINSVIHEQNTLLRANQIAGITPDFKMVVIKRGNHFSLRVQVMTCVISLSLGKIHWSYSNARASVPSLIPKKNDCSLYWWSLKLSARICSLRRILGRANRGFFSFTMIMVVCWFLIKVTCTWIVYLFSLAVHFFSMIGLQAESGAVLTNIVWKVWKENDSLFMETSLKFPISSLLTNEWTLFSNEICKT